MKITALIIALLMDYIMMMIIYVIKIAKKLENILKTINVFQNVQVNMVFI